MKHDISEGGRRASWCFLTWRQKQRWLQKHCVFIKS